MRLREIYRCLVPVTILIILMLTGNAALAQQSLLDREVNLSRNTGAIDVLLREISRKGNFSFTYTSRINGHQLTSVINRKQTVRNHLNDIFRYDSIQYLEQNKKILLIPMIKKPLPVTGFRSISGLVIDSKNRRPLAYTNIFISNKSTGTISNSTGRFELKISPGQLYDTLGISHIGYQMIYIPIASIDSSRLIVRLNADRIPIKEVVVKPLDPIYILTKSVEKIPHNYDKKPALYTGFFRETIQQDNKNVSLSEAIINIFKEPYLSSRSDQVKIFKGRKGTNTDEMEFVDFIVQGGLYNTLQLDIVKNLPSFLDVDYFALYSYELEKIISHFERLTYVIAFDRMEGVKYPCYKGKVYIDVETLAIVGASFEMPATGMTYAAGIYVKKAPRHTGVKPLNAYYHVFYRLYNNKWNLCNVRSELLIRVKRRKDKQQNKFNSVFASVSEFVITDKDSINVTRFKTDEVARPKDILEEQIGETDYEFWGNENIIIPDEPIEKTVLRLRKKNNILSEQEIEAIRIEEKKDEQQRISDTEDQINDKNTDEPIDIGSE